MKNKKLKVGITTHPRKGVYFNSGLHQNSQNLFKLLKRSNLIKPYMVYPEMTHPDLSGPVRVFGEKVYPMWEKSPELDVLLQVSYGIWDEEDCERFVDSGVKLVKIHYGNVFMNHQEELVFGPHLKGGERIEGPLTINASGHLRNKLVHTDAAWVSPHFEWSKQYFGWCDNTKDVSTCPYIWSPEIMKSGNPNHDNLYFKRNDKTNKSIFVMEPNVNVVKASYAPLIMTEILYRKDPNAFDAAFMFCMGKYRKNEKMIKYLSSYSSVADKKVTFENRYLIQTILSNAGVMLHHHLLNSLNYTLLEASYFKLPAVHNSEPMKDFGYYYHNTNVHDGASQLEAALNHSNLSDAELEQYEEACDDNLWKYSIDNPDNLKSYEELILNVINKK